MRVQEHISQLSYLPTIILKLTPTGACPQQLSINNDRSSWGAGIKKQHHPEHVICKNSLGWLQTSSQVKPKCCVTRQTIQQICSFHQNSAHKRLTNVLKFTSMFVYTVSVQHYFLQQSRCFFWLKIQSKFFFFNRFCL